MVWPANQLAVRVVIKLPSTLAGVGALECCLRSLGLVGEKFTNGHDCSLHKRIQIGMYPNNAHYICTNDMLTLRCGMKG